MERLTGISQRVRKFNFIEQMTAEEERYNAKLLQADTSGITVVDLDRHGARADGQTGIQSSDRGDDSDSNFMRFDEMKDSRRRYDEAATPDFRETTKTNENQ